MSTSMFQLDAHATTPMPLPALYRLCKDRNYPNNKEMDSLDMVVALLLIILGCVDGLS